MRAINPEIFNNNRPYNLVSRIYNACNQPNIKSYIQKGWVMIPTRQDADLLASHIMKEVKEEFGEESTILINGDIIWQMCSLEL